MFDVLGRIPSVSVAPSGAVTLLGADNVTIQINGQPVPGDNLEQVLARHHRQRSRAHRGDHQPIGAIFGAASGGIINIITRQRFDTGFSGNIQASPTRSAAIMPASRQAGRADRGRSAASVGLYRRPAGQRLQA